MINLAAINKKKADTKTEYPMNALSEVAGVAGKDAVIDSGIGSHLRRSGFYEACMVFSSPANCNLWRAEIEATLAKEPNLLARWWRGVDTGISSQEIYFAITGRRDSDYHRDKGTTPRDSGDFGRCQRLVALLAPTIMSARDQLNLVAKTYPDTKWPAIVARWDELCALDAVAQTKLLDYINSEGYKHPETTLPVG